MPSRKLSSAAATTHPAADRNRDRDTMRQPNPAAHQQNRTAPRAASVATPPHVLLHRIAQAAEADKKCAAGFTICRDIFISAHHKSGRRPRSSVLLIPPCSDQRSSCRSSLFVPVFKYFTKTINFPLEMFLTHVFPLGNIRQNLQQIRAMKSIFYC